MDRTVLKENHFRFVKNIPKKNGNFDLALRKRRFCKVLIHSWLCQTFAYKISLHIFSLFLP
ncbi:hypothetical protein CTM50_04205 [Prevotella intermedia]|uniref:Uncharacterized protein n=1 Tax=Prevotella intermedia TaxID=28131 RepID=A0A2D3NFR5_PREIN|nr:hypothetical protein CTM50_04205 [Prevotella intermedia]